MDREIWRGKDVGYIVKKKMNRSCRKNGMVSVNRWGFRSVNRAVKKGEGKEMDQEEETAEKDNADVVTEDDFVPEEAAEEPVKDQKEDLVEESGEMTENTTEEETKQEEEPVSEPEE